MSTPAHVLKDEGNKQFQAGDNVGASTSYTEALALLENEGPKADFGLKRVLYSNRSAARLNVGDFQAALADAEECLKLAPAWSRGLSRKAMALLKLNKFDDAIHCFEQALLGDPTNPSLLEHLSLAQKRQVTVAPPPPASKTCSTSADSLADFFQEVEELEHLAEKKPTLVDHEKETAGWTSKNQLDRLLQPHHRFLNLNPYLVFGLSPDANEEDIKKRYHKLSALVHPDKNPDESERATLAFEVVTWANTELKQEFRRQYYLETFSLCRNQVLKRNPSASEMDVELEIKRVLALAEQNRIKAEKIRQANEEVISKSIMAKEPNWAAFKREEDLVKEGTQERVTSWNEFRKKQKKM